MCGKQELLGHLQFLCGRKLFLVQNVRSFQSSASCFKKKDFFKTEKLPVFDYAKISAEHKRIYVFGCSVHGAIGLRNLLRPDHKHHRLKLFVERPVRHKFFNDMDIEDVCAGHGFSLFAVRRKNVNYPALFGCGLNESSQLGYQAARSNAPMERLIAPTGISLPIQAERPKILAIAAGRGHSVVSVQNEGLMTFGDNSVGQCGRPIVERETFLGSRFVHRLSHFIGSEEIIGLASRFDLTVCLSKSGRVYTCGEDATGQLGRGKAVLKKWDLTTPLKGDIENEKIVKIATNGISCLAVSDKGELFAWGCNEVGQIKPGQISTIFREPVHVNLGERVGKILDIAMGDMSTYVLNDAGNMFVWGHGPTLGLGPQTLNVRQPTIIPPPLFGRNEFNEHVRVTSICAGFVHSSAINSTGDVFTWGSNNSGCLGLGLGKQQKHQFFPLKVCLNGTARKVALGVDHTIILCTGSF